MSRVSPGHLYYLFLDISPTYFSKIFPQKQNLEHQQSENLKFQKPRFTNRSPANRDLFYPLPWWHIDGATKTWVFPTVIKKLVIGGMFACVHKHNYSVSRPRTHTHRHGCRATQPHAQAPQIKYDRPVSLAGPLVHWTNARAGETRVSLVHWTSDRAGSKKHTIIQIGWDAGQPNQRPGD